MSKRSDGWFDGCLSAEWRFMWHYLRREAGATYWGACGLWAADKPGPLIRATPERGPICGTCSDSLKVKPWHYRDGRFRTLCGRRKTDVRSTSLVRFVTCQECRAIYVAAQK